MGFCDFINIAKVEVLVLLKEILNGELEEGLSIVGFMGCGESWGHLLEKFFHSIAKAEDADLDLIFVVILYF